jgi:hypothetical protein
VAGAIDAPHGICVAADQSMRRSDDLAYTSEGISKRARVAKIASNHLGTELTKVVGLVRVARESADGMPMLQSTPNDRATQPTRCSDDQFHCTPRTKPVRGSVVLVTHGLNCV